MSKWSFNLDALVNTVNTFNEVQPVKLFMSHSFQVKIIESSQCGAC